MKKYVRISNRVYMPIADVIVCDLDTGIEYRYTTRKLAEENHGFRVGSHPKALICHGHFSWKSRAFAWSTAYPMPNKLKYYKKFWEHLVKVEAAIGVPLHTQDKEFIASTFRRIHTRCYAFFGLRPGSQCESGKRHTEESLNGI